MTTRIMRDSTVITDIPVPGTDIVAAYSNGIYAATSIEVQSRFPGIPVAWIDVIGDNPHAHIADIEPSDISDQAAVRWVQSKLAIGGSYLPILYSDRSNLTPLFNALAIYNLRVGTHFRLWIATLDGTVAVPDMFGVTAVQDKGQDRTHGHYDESVVYDPAFLPSRPISKPLPPPPPPQHAVLIGTDLKCRDVTSSDGIHWS